MYIHATYSFMHSNEAVGFYKKKVKEITQTSMRRASKFNLLSLYGACKCIEDRVIPSDTSIYIGSEFGVVSGVQKVMESLNEEPVIVMPFDFLNMNGNNAGFAISKVLDTNGENILMTASDLTFELTLKQAFYKCEQNKNFSALIGGVDESIVEIDRYQTYVIDQKQIPYDGSCWLYCNNEANNAIAKITSVQNFANEQSLDEYIASNHFDEISYNFLARSTVEKAYFYGTQSANDIIDLLRSEEKHLAYVSKDRQGRFIFIEIDKL